MKNHIARRPSFPAAVVAATFLLAAETHAQQMNTSHLSGRADTRFTIDATGALDIRPSATSSKNDFDFLQGKWQLHNRKLKTRLSHSDAWIEFPSTLEMRKSLRGIGNTDDYKAVIEGEPFEGMSVRLFNPATRLWSVYWADSNTGVLDKPVVGSFENGVGKFYTRDTFQGKPIIMQFEYDQRDPAKPVWRQAFSDDDGKTWEWNWYMYMTRYIEGAKNANADRSISVLELRNYAIKPDMRDTFIDYFNANLVDPQNALGGFVLGQYRVKGEDDNFFWIRGYQDMAARSRYLPAFYQGPVWKARRDIPNGMLVNNDNVHLLKPLVWVNNKLTPGSINSDMLKSNGNIAVVDYYISNTRLQELIRVYEESYIPLLKKCGVQRSTFWISELQKNDFPALPVFQDKDLLVTITFYKDELEYRSRLRQLEAMIDPELSRRLRDCITMRRTLIVYPSEGSF